MVKEEQSQADPRSAGALLRAARESSGMSIEQVADKLHLLQSVVKSLEKDCYERIRGETFVRGYMRNYARLLGISDDEVVGRYNASRPLQGRGESRFSRKREQWHRSAGAGRIGVVLVLMAASVAFLFHTRAPVAGSLERSIDAVTVETVRGLQVVPLASPAAPSQ